MRNESTLFCTCTASFIWGSQSVLPSGSVSLSPFYEWGNWGTTVPSETQWISSRTGNRSQISKLPLSSSDHKIILPAQLEEIQNILLFIFQWLRGPCQYKYMPQSLHAKETLILHFIFWDSGIFWCTKEPRKDIFSPLLVSKPWKHQEYWIFDFHVFRQTRGLEWKLSQSLSELSF